MIQLALHSTTLIIWDYKMDLDYNLSLNLIVTTFKKKKKNREKSNIIY